MQAIFSELKDFNDRNTLVVSPFENINKQFIPNDVTSDYWDIVKRPSSYNEDFCVPAIGFYMQGVLKSREKKVAEFDTRSFATRLSLENMQKRLKVSAGNYSLY